MKLSSGASTTALLQILDAGDHDPKQCAPTTVNGLRIYPPGSKASAYVPFGTHACHRDPGDSNQLSVSRAGTWG